MLNSALKLLKKIESHHFKAYIVGGFARDLYLGIESFDVDICTNATPKDLQEIFETSKLSNETYGSLSLYYNKIRFEITTFRIDLKYIDNRKPIKIKYIDDLKQDLLRRDFTINTLCINSNGEYIDLLNARADIDAHIIKVVGNPKRRLKEDSLRILRAVRFATVLDFKIDPKVKKYIKKHAYLLKKLSYYRKKEELDKIFTSKNRVYGISLLKELDLLTVLEIPNLPNIVLTDSIIGIWAQLNPVNYQLTTHEKEMISSINSILKGTIDKNMLYQHGLYNCEIAGEIMGIDKAIIVALNSQIAINNSKAIVIDPLQIAAILNKQPGSFLKDIISDLEEKIVNDKLENNYEILKNYIIKNY